MCSFRGSGSGTEHASSDVVRVFLQYLRKNSVISTVCGHDGSNNYCKTEYETGKNGSRMSCYRSRPVRCF